MIKKEENKKDPSKRVKKETNVSIKNDKEELERNKLILLNEKYNSINHLISYYSNIATINKYTQEKDAQYLYHSSLLKIRELESKKIDILKELEKIILTEK